MGAELKIEQDLRRFVERLGGLCLKFTSPEYSGVPDRVILLKGRVWFVELKAPRGILSPRQAYVHYTFEKCGIVVHLLWNDEQLNLFKHVLQAV